MYNRQLKFHLILAAPLAVLLLVSPAVAADLSAPIQKLINDRCVECHNEDLKSGGMNLQQLAADFAPARDEEDWVKVEAALVQGKMPPKDEERLKPEWLRQFNDWFDNEFVMPGGVQHAGASVPRRLTREELQNTLEDILHVDIRVTVTNSRLHVIPDTIIEKFFAAGVRGESGFSNEAATLSREPVNIQTYARCFSLVLSLLDSNATARKKLFGSEALPEKIDEAEARRVITRFGEAAFRRPLTEAEAEAFLTVFRTMSKRKTAYESIKSSFLAVLLSPPFLFRFEEPVEADSSESRQAEVTGNELAVRLSYFLWSAPPDKTLLELAAKGELREPDVLIQQTRRMLADPRRIALAENLGGEWFDYKKLRQQSSVNKRSDRMAGFYRTQWEEALLFFDSLIRYDQPVFRLVDADWAFINRHQSGIYRLPTAAMKFEGGKELAPINIHYRSPDRQIAQGNYEYKHAPLGLVKLNDPNRGGFLTLGPTLSVTSTPNRTSPIRRGVWVMERILGEHFEVPEDVPDLEATRKKAKTQQQNLSETEILKLHSSQEGCASCHQYIDPIGFGLEVYDQLGISRMNSQATPGGEKLQWTPKLTPRPYADRTWLLTKPLIPGAETRVFFHYTKGRHRLSIRNVRLQSGAKMVVDKHFGFTGNAQQNNVWFFAIPKDAPPDGWILTAEIEGDGGTDSSGTITVSGPDDKAEGYKLPNGKSFSTPAELKRLLLSDYRDQITDNVIRRVLSYAAGRKTRPIDRPAIRKIRESLKANDYRMTALIEAVVLSYPFRHKEN